MKKKFLCTPLFIAALLCTPYTQIDLAADLDSCLVVGALSGDVNALASPAAAAAAQAESAPVPAETPAQEAVPEDAGQLQALSFSSSIGTLTWYSQSDPRWADFLYGGSDPMSAYGCGPTVMAMIVSSFTGQTLLPPDMADWASSNGYWAYQSGTAHSFIPECAISFGLKAESAAHYTADSILAALKEGHIFVALVGPGHFSDNGHFIIISDYWSGTQVTVADPASLERTRTPWDINLILSELSSAGDAGAPLWIITPG